MESKASLWTKLRNLLVERQDNRKPKGRQPRMPPSSPLPFFPMLANAPHEQHVDGGNPPPPPKGQGKKKKGSAVGFASETKNGKKVCFAYNNPHGCKKANCTFTHACSIKVGSGHACGMDHPAMKHDEARHGRLEKCRKTHAEPLDR